MDPELLSELKKRVATEPIPKNDKRAKLSEIVEEAEASESEEESDEEEVIFIIFSNISLLLGKYSSTKG